MSQPNREELYQMAVSAARNGQKQGARMMFRRILSENPGDERVLIWMAKLANNTTDRRKWLERVLELNPDNETALRVIGQMQHHGMADRNKALFRIGIVAYVVVVILASFLIIISTLSQAAV